MGRYIEVDDVANAIYHHFPSIRTMADARGIIEEAPSIDIVRCKECKSRGFYLEDADMYICNACDQLAFDPMHFCSYGEREGE